MRPSQKNNRPRNKGGRKAPGPSVNRVYDSSGPEGKVRGTPQQIIEKYQALARDKTTSGDRVMAENFLQHAEHYVRILTAAQAAAAPVRREEPREFDGREEFDAPPRETTDADGDAVSDGMMVMGGDEDAGPDMVGATADANGGRRRGRARENGRESADEDGPEAAADAPRRRSTRRPARRGRSDEAPPEGEEAAPRRRTREASTQDDEPAPTPINGAESGEDAAANGAGGDWDHDEVPQTVN